MKKIFLSFLFGISICGNVIAQEDLTLKRDPYLENFSYQVPQIGEFMSRINGESELISQLDSLRGRELCILSLFHRDVIERDTVVVKDFIDKVIADSVSIHFEDSTWCAVATLKVSVKGKGDDLINLIFKTQKRAEFMYKWVVSDAFGDVLELTPAKTNPGLMISPTENELNFISVPQTFNAESENILNYIASDGSVNTLSVFLSMLYTKSIVIKEVMNLYYVFDNIAGYRLVVDQYSGTTRRAGWLITEISSVE